MADAAVARILSARTHYAVLELAGDRVVAPTVVRRQYKVLAIRVHPDKNRADGAADAFKRLSEAYECLADEHTQRQYLSALSRPTATHKPPPPSQPRARPPTHQPPFPTKQRTKKKRKPPPPPVAETPRRRRTPEEIWEQFQRQEEEQAKREFMARGFDRDYEPSTPPHRKRAVPYPDADQEADPMTAQGVETRARDWTQWKRSRTTAESLTPSPPQAAATTTPGEEIVCCLLCRRKFPTLAALTRHEQLSALHKENVARQAAGMASGDQVSRATRS